MPETIPTVQDVIEMRVAELEADLRMVDARLAAVRWGSHTGLAYAVLDHRRQQLLADLADL